METGRSLNALHLESDSLCRVDTDVPSLLAVVKDRDYIAYAIDGTEYRFSHFLVAPIEPINEEELTLEYGKIASDDCSF
jgi:hypothetical protein